MTSEILSFDGIPDNLPPLKSIDPSVPHAPPRPQVLDERGRILAIENSLNNSIFYVK